MSWVTSGKRPEYRCISIIPNSVQYFLFFALVKKRPPSSRRKESSVLYSRYPEIDALIFLMADVSDIDVLSEHKIIATPEISGFICEPCDSEISIKTKQSFKSHAKNKHRMDAEAQTKLYEAMLRVRATFACQPETVALYRGSVLCPNPLPSLKGLTVEETRRCNLCPALFKSLWSFKSHLKSDHGVTSDFAGVWKTAPLVKAQTLSKKKGEEKYFPVEIFAENSIGFPQHDQNGIGILLDAYNPASVLTMTDVPSDEREHSPFIFIVKPQERLRRLKLDMESAVSVLASTSDVHSGLYSSSISVIRRSLENYYKECKALGDVGVLFSGTYLDIATPGTREKTRHFRFLDDNSSGSTLDRYLHHTACLILMALRVYLDGTKDSSESFFSGITMSEDQKCCSSTLIQETESGCLDTTQPIHNLLFSIFFQEGSLVDGPAKLFMYAYASCACVTAKGDDLPRYRVGTEVSAVISGPLHIASCVALMAVKTYNVMGTEDEAMVHVKNCLEPSKKSGVSILSGLRSQCYSLREMEMEKITYAVCEHADHQHCGFINGIEIRAEQVGDVLKKIQKKIHSELFGTRGLFEGKRLPPLFREKQSGMVDRISEKKAGYWFKSDPRNSAFVEVCKTWVRQSCVVRLSRSQMIQWTKRAQKIAQYLVCAMHISGGAPGRGTEIGVNSVMNKPCGRRTLFFVGSECIIVPYYSKMRMLKMGLVSFLTRHLDAETTYLLKSYLLLVHYVACTFQNWNDQNTAESGVDAPVDAEKLDSRWILLCADSMPPRKVAQVMNKLFEEFDFPLTFSEYRQWQRGYAKYRGSYSVRKAMEVASGCQPSEDVEADGGAASILQAGHSVRSAEAFYARIEDSFKGTTGKNRSLEMRTFQKASHEWHVDLKVRKEDTTSQSNTKDCACGSTEVALTKLVTAVQQNTEMLRTSMDGNSFDIAIDQQNNPEDNASVLEQDAKSSLQRAVSAVGYFKAVQMLGELGSASCAPPRPAACTETPPTAMNQTEQNNVCPPESNPELVPSEATQASMRRSFHALSALRKACGVPTAEFRSREQEKSNESTVL